MSDDVKLVCPGCEATFGAASDISGEIITNAPPVGSIGMCAECGLDVVYMGTYLRSATIEEIKTIPEGLREEARELARELGFKNEIDISNLVLH